MASRFRVERSQIIAADAAAILPEIVDFHRWRSWSPYEGLDPALKRTYSGAASGPGANYTWEGNGKAGAGRMEVLAVEPDRQVTIRLGFTRPMRASNIHHFTLAAEPAGTRMTWSMEGARSMLFTLLGLVMSMDKLIGRDFEKGFASLKAEVEGTLSAATDRKLPTSSS